ncbi:hypothetical protein QFZ83_002381 [Variovorax sp. W1I1]|nr:hypothetical protein [Variovorax sp. W1I1]
MPLDRGLGQPAVPHHERAAELSHQFLEGIGRVTEAAPEAAVQPPRTARPMH